MITLNLERGLVRLLSWEDIESRPGFARKVDPKLVKLREFIGWYEFSTTQPCGLANCRQPHGKGYLVVFEDGRETNLGHVCGRNNFKETFAAMRVAFDRARREQERREVLQTMQNRLPVIIAEVAALRDGPQGAAWMHPKLDLLSGRVGGLPSQVLSAVRDARARNGNLVIERRATAAEREQSAVHDVAGLEQLKRREQFVFENVGQLDGFAALSPDMDIRAILVRGLTPLLSDLERTDIDSLQPRDLATLSKRASEVDGLLERLRTAVAQGRRLLCRENIAQLFRYVDQVPEIRRMHAFANDLPVKK